GGLGAKCDVDSVTLPASLRPDHDSDLTVGDVPALIFLSPLHPRPTPLVHHLNDLVGFDNLIVPCRTSESSGSESHALVAPPNESSSIVQLHLAIDFVGTELAAPQG